uniref:Uncharacterized protein n=1 Tax=Arundo donax TaxID=35708 RepID=A0A0A9GQF1_ARUDO
MCGDKMILKVMKIQQYGDAFVTIAYEHIFRTRNSLTRRNNSLERNLHLLRTAVSEQSTMEGNMKL